MPVSERMQFEESLVGEAHQIGAKAAATPDLEAALLLFARAYERLRALMEVNPRHVLGLRNWSWALFRNAARMSRAEADRLYAQAAEKYSLALAVVPEDASLTACLGHTFLRRAILNETGEAAELIARARELLELALRIQPGLEYAQILWAHALSEQAKLAPGVEMDRTLAEACAAIEAAAAHSVHFSRPLRALAAILFAQGMRASGEESKRLLRAAKEKFLGSESRERGAGAYRAACVCARLGEEAECQRWLKASGEPGILVTREELAAEPHFESVRNYEWFQRLVQPGKCA